MLIWIAKLQIVECNALPTLILMLQSENAAIHYEAVSSGLCILFVIYLEILQPSVQTTKFVYFDRLVS